MKKSVFSTLPLMCLCFLVSCTVELTDTTGGWELNELREATGLEAEYISFEGFAKGTAPEGFEARTGAPYKPCRNEDPAIPVQCWIETGYGTQNACKYCHTDYLALKKHGNSLPLGEDQILYSFPSPNLNRVNWRNVTHPQEILRRLEKEGIEIPKKEDPENLAYIRQDNWTAAYRKARPDGNDTWNNLKNAGCELQLMPALDPNDLFPCSGGDPTQGGRHGYVDREGFVRDRNDGITGWRAVNFFPYAIFTPLTGSVSGIYIRLPEKFMSEDGKKDMGIYKENLDILERNIKDSTEVPYFYKGDAAKVAVKKGFYPKGTEIAHPLHYVDLDADGEGGKDYEFPGTRSKRVKEVRYMYKWKEVGLEDIGGDEEDEDEGEDEEEEEEEAETVIGKEWKGWIDNDAGWILAAYIEDRKGNIRPQTTEELVQCLGCHSSVGNTVDAVWSFQRKLPGDLGWGEMDYGGYRKSEPHKTRLEDYMNDNVGMGELEYFYYSVVGADLFGVMPEEIKRELIEYADESGLQDELDLKNPLSEIFDDHKLKSTGRDKRKEIIQERARIMRRYASSRAYLLEDAATGNRYIKGNIFYPSEATMRGNIAGYRRIVLDQSFNLGKNVFGTQPEAIPFTFRSDGTVVDGEGRTIPVGEVITSRPWGKDGVGTTPTGIVKINEEGEPVDDKGDSVDLERNPDSAAGHISKGGTFDTRYNPILTGKPVKKGR